MLDWMRRAMDLIDSTDGRTFGAEFVKADGTVRTGSFRIAYRWERKTDNPKLSRTYAREAHGNVKVVCMRAAAKHGKERAIRTIKLARLRALTVDGQRVEFPGG